MKTKTVGRGILDTLKFKRIVSLILSISMLLTLIAGVNLSAYAVNVSGDYEYELLDDGTVEISKYIGNDSSIIIPNKIDEYVVTSIKSFAFCDCNFLEQVEIPNGIVKIGKYAFGRCQNLKKVFIPETIEELADYYDNAPGFYRESPFVDCSSLEEFVVDNNNLNYSSQDGVLFNKNKTKLIQYPSGNIRKEYEIPNGVLQIESLTIVAKYLQKLIIPESVTKLGGQAITLRNNEPKYVVIKNPDCNILGMYGGDENIPFYGGNYTICGYKDSSAELFAKNRGFSFVVLNENQTQLKFRDLSEYSYYNDYVMYTSVYNKFIAGTNPPYYTEFSPRTAITRAMFVAILYRMAGNPYDGANPYTSNPFSDVSPSAYYYNAACWALDEGITNQTTFKPNNNVTREQTARFLYAYAESKGLLGDEAYKSVNLGKYPDYNSVHSWAVEPLQWANYNDMITGTQQGYINPQGATQRIHATRILYGFGKVCNIGNFE